VTDQHLASDAGVADLLWQADQARALGSPLVGAVLAASARQLHRAPHTAALLARWPGDRAAAAVAMRFNAALHALARRDTPPRLGALYRGEHDDVDGAIGEALAQHDAEIAEWVRQTPQTNEVGRAAAIVAALMVARTRFDLPVELHEIGSSAGLNLNLDRYGYRLGALTAGVADSPVQVAPDWEGASPPAAPIALAAACGVDLAPLDVADPATRDRLMAFVFADQPARALRLERAIDLALRHPPRVARGDALDWVEAHLRAPAPAGRCRAVVHSMVAQYLGAAGRARLDALVAAAGTRATVERPLVRIGFEWTEDRAEVQLRLTCYPGGDTRVLATCHPYGTWIRWRDDTA
jgi:hypothetical protein